MPTIDLQTTIRAPIGRVFDLCRSVNAHVATAKGTHEEAVGGVTTGLMELGDAVTWSARHLVWRWRLTSQTTQMDRPQHFRDSMTAGVFHHFDHDHFFEADGELTRIRDRFEFRSPLGPLGTIADALFVTRHMRSFLSRRMQSMRGIAESGDWERYLPSNGDV